MDKGKFGLSILAIFAITAFGLFTTLVLPTAVSPKNVASGSVTKDLKVITQDDLVTHNTKEDCYLLIHGYVYDVSGYAPLHPGGETIFQGCGMDATSLFENRWMGSGTPHSEAARQVLVKYRIGVIESTQ